MGRFTHLPYAITTIGVNVKDLCNHSQLMAYLRLEFGKSGEEFGQRLDVIVWAAAMKVGCAAQKCSKENKRNGEPVDQTVAMLYVYDKGPEDQSEQLYETGKVCEKCPSGYKTCLKRALL
nr:hypothetical transcript [Hymenolepis microstoma]